MKTRKINYLGLLSLLSIISILGIFTENKGLFGFFGFIYFIRYFWIVPDELFQLNVQKAGLLSFMAQLIVLIPIIFIAIFTFGEYEGVLISFAISFFTSILVFTFSLYNLERKEAKGVSND